MRMSNEAKVGLMAAAVVLILAVLTIKAGNFSLSKKKGYILKVHFQQIDGIEKNAPVLVNGFELGHVKSIDILDKPDQTIMQLNVWLSEDVRLREGAVAYVKNLGFLGEKYIGLTTGTPGKAFLKEGAIVNGKEPADMDRLLRDGQEIAGNLKAISSNLNERLESNKENIDQIFQNGNAAFKNFAAITENVNQRLKVNEQNIDDMMANMHSTSKNLDQFSYDLKLNPWKLLYRSKEKRMESVNQDTKAK